MDQEIIIDYKIIPKGEEIKFSTIESLKDTSIENIKIVIREKSKEKIEGRIILTGELYEKWKGNLKEAGRFVKNFFESLINDIEIIITDITTNTAPRNKRSTNGKPGQSNVQVIVSVCSREKELDMHKIITNLLLRIQHGNFVDIVKEMSLLDKRKDDLYIIIDIFYIIEEIQKYVKSCDKTYEHVEIDESEIKSFLEEAYNRFSQTTGIEINRILKNNEADNDERYERKYKGFLKKTWRLFKTLNFEPEFKEKLHLAILKPLRNVVAHLDDKPSDMYLNETKKKIKKFINEAVPVYISIIRKMLLHLSNLDKYYKEGSKIYEPNN